MKPARASSLTVCAEPLCPDSTAFVLGDLESVLSSCSVDFTFVPFGNAYFANGSSDAYSSSAGDLWEAACASDAPQPRPEGCFDGALVCQHGTVECALLRKENCVRRHTQNDRIFPYVKCLYQSNYGRSPRPRPVCTTVMRRPWRRHSG